MKYRKLGASDLSVSEISLGTWLTFGVGVAHENALACVNRAFELGINFIDTANTYGKGAAESLLGEALAGRPRDSYVLATKVFSPMSEHDRGLSRKQILLGVLDLGSSDVETAEQVAARIRNGLRHVAAERLIPAPDCGMKYLPRERAFGKLQALAAGAAIVRQELAG